MPIKNFAEVIPDVLYRGSRPSPEDFKQQLANMKSIINLEGDDVAAAEYQSAASLGMEWIWCPISISDIYAEGFPEPLCNYLLALMKWLPKPLFVHCQHGEDRTGLAVAMFRVEEQGWSPQQAYQEALRYGYHPHFNAGLNKNFEKLGAKISDWVI